MKFEFQRVADMVLIIKFNTRKLRKRINRLVNVNSLASRLGRTIYEPL
jgi:hypothetical protein